MLRKYKAGDHARFVQEYSLHPYTTIALGETAIVAFNDLEHAVMGLRLSTPHVGLRMWDNIITISAADPDLDKLLAAIEFQSSASGFLAKVAAVVLCLL